MSMSGHLATTPGLFARGWVGIGGEQLRVLQAVADGRVDRSLLCGRLEPHLLDGRDVIWVLRSLVLHGLVRLQPVGPPLITRRGRALLDGPD
jgi:hypothetical protein